MNTLCKLSFPLVIVFVGSQLEACGENLDSLKIGWRIPSTHVSEAPIDWLSVRHADAANGRMHINLEAGIGDHYNYETAWNYYAEKLGGKLKYRDWTKNPSMKIAPHARETEREGGPFVSMAGLIDDFHVTLYLWADDQSDKSKDRVYVKILFVPNRK